MTAPDLITTADVAEMAGVSPRTVQTWRTRGTGPCFQRIGATYVVYDRAEVQRWLKQDYRPIGGVPAHKPKPKAEGA